MLQLDLLVYYWSKVDSGVKIKFGLTKAQDMVTEILLALEKLSITLKLMPSLTMDGPDVSKCILIKLNQVKKKKGYQQLVKCPPICLIHVCHNSLKKGISKYGCKIEELCLNLYYFKRSSH